MPEFLTTRELADLLRIKERKVYDLASSGAVPCSRATGKLLFPREAIMAWLEAHETAPQVPSAQSRPPVFLGSHDPLLDWAIRESQCGVATIFDSSGDGLARFERGEGIAAGVHLFDPGTTNWNDLAISTRFRAEAVVLIRWAIRQRGLILSDQIAQRVTTLGDLAGLRLVPRQSGAGAQVLLEHLMAEAGLSPDEVTFVPPARSEADAALLVREGRADATLGLASVAFHSGLRFLPLVDERFDLLIDRRAWFETPFQTLLNFTQGSAFAARAKAHRGYDVSNLGRVIFNGP